MTRAMRTHWPQKMKKVVNSRTIKVGAGKSGEKSKGKEFLESQQSNLTETLDGRTAEKTLPLVGHSEPKNCIIIRG